MLKRVHWLNVVAVMLFATRVFAADPSPAIIKNQIDAFIKSASNKYKANQMEASAGKHLLGDINGDGNADVVLLYDLLGPTYSYTKLAVFVNENGKLKLASEVDLDGQVDLDAVKDGKILVSGKRAAPNDPRCCPSIPFKAAYSLKGKKLVTTKP